MVGREGRVVASGAKHAMITKALTIPTMIGVTAVTGNVGAGLIAATGTLSGLFVDPDLDQPILTRSERRVIRWLGPLGWVWAWWWIGYAYLIPHRSPLSHLPILGTIGRVVYVMVPISAILFLATGSLDIVAGVLQSSVFWLWFIGLCVADIGHWVADGFPLASRKWIR